MYTALLLGMATAIGQDLVEFPEGEILASIRVRSMGGAATGVAESASALLLNPAAIAMRRPMTEPMEIDPDLTLQARDHPLLDAAWEIATGQAPPPPPRRLALWQLGVGSRFGRAGGALHFRGHSWDTGQAQVGSSLWSVGGGYSGDTWALGVMPHVLSFNRGASSSLGFGTSLGGLWAPEDSPLRLGARVRTPIKTAEVAPAGIAASRLPLEAAVGGSYAIGAHNVVGLYGPERHQGAWLAPVLVLAADVVMTGGTGDAVALEPLAERERQARSGPTASLRFGAEANLLHQDLRLRAGTYTIPGRGAGSSTVVATGGASYELAEDSRGLAIRAAGLLEAWSDGWTWSVGLETW